MYQIRLRGFLFPCDCGRLGTGVYSEIMPYALRINASLSFQAVHSVSLTRTTQCMAATNPFGNLNNTDVEPGGNAGSQLGKLRPRHTRSAEGSVSCLAVI